MTSKSKKSEDKKEFGPRWKVEDEPELIELMTVKQETYQWVNNHWKFIGRRYSNMATPMIAQDAAATDLKE